MAMLRYTAFCFLIASMSEIRLGTSTSVLRKRKRGRSYGHPRGPEWKFELPDDPLVDDILDIWGRPLSDQIYHAKLVLTVAGDQNFVVIEAAPNVRVKEIEDRQKILDWVDPSSKDREMLQITHLTTYLPHLEHCQKLDPEWTLRADPITVREVVENAFTYKKGLWDARSSNCQHFVRDMILKKSYPPLLEYNKRSPTQRQENEFADFMDGVNHQSKDGLLSTRGPLQHIVKPYETGVRAANAIAGLIKTSGAQRVLNKFGDHEVVRLSVWWTESTDARRVTNKDTRKRDIERRKDFLRSFC